jgi:hypothetical protein
MEAVAADTAGAGDQPEFGVADGREDGWWDRFLRLGDLHISHPRSPKPL